MGFTADVAATVDADLLKYAFEQQIANLLRSGNTYAELHKGATNDLIRRLRAQGYTTSQISGITNTEDFKPALVSWVLSKIFAGQGGRTPAERDQALGKAAYYEAQYEKLASGRSGGLAVVLADASVKTSRGLPFGVNVDSGSRFPALGTCRPAGISTSDMSGFDRQNLEGRP